MKLRNMTVGEVLFYFIVGFSLAIISSKMFAQTVGTGTATLSWTIPTEYTDGSPMPVEDIQRYTIYFGTESRNYTDSVEVSLGAVQSRQVELELTQPTTFYFAITAWARDLESDYSNEASKFIDFVLEDVPPGAPMNVTLDISMTCESGEAGRTCTVVIQ